MILYFLLKGKDDVSLPRTYAVFYGMFIITVNLGYLNTQNKVNSPVFIYNDSNLSLNDCKSGIFLCPVHFENLQQT